MAEGHLMYIAGEQVSAASGATEAVVNPATNERIATVPMGDATDVDRAVAAADEAFDDWAATTPGKRAELLLKLADRLEAHAEEFAQLESHNVGKPIAVARDEVHPVALHDHRHDQQHFHHRHVDARAQARPAAEGEVGMPRPTFRSRRQEALGVEGFRVVPELWVAMGEIGAQEDCRSCRNPEPADLIVIASRGMTHTGG